MHTKIKRVARVGRVIEAGKPFTPSGQSAGAVSAISWLLSSRTEKSILVSAGLNATLNTGEHQVQISNGVPLGTLGNAYLNQLSQRCDAWQCQIWGTGGRLRLMLSAE